MARPFTSTIMMITGIVIPTIIAVILSILSLSSGAQFVKRHAVLGSSTFTNSFKKFAILTFDTSSVNSALANVTSYPDLIQDWYEVHYLAVCSGMWNAHTVSAGKNQSTITCTPQTGGYTFVLVQEILLNDPFLPLLVDSPYGTLDTKAPLILFTIGFSFTALSLLGYLYSLLFTMATPKAKISLGLLRVACLLNIPAFIFLMISSAEITVLARKLVGTGDIGLGLVHTSIDKGFYVSAWLAAAFMFVALGIGVVKAFILVRVQQSRESNTRDGQNTVEESIQSRIPEQKVSIIQ